MIDQVLDELTLRSKSGLSQCRARMAQLAAEAGIGRGAVTRAVTAVSEVTRTMLLITGGEAGARFLSRVVQGRRQLVLELEGRPLAVETLPQAPSLAGAVDAVQRLLDTAAVETLPCGRQRVVLALRLPDGVRLRPPAPQAAPPAVPGNPAVAPRPDATALALAAVQAATWRASGGRISLDRLGLALFGLTEFDGSTRALLDCLHPGDGALLGEALGRADTFCRTLRLVRRDGEIRDVEMIGGPLPDGAGLGGVLLDVTERLAAQRDQNDRQRQKLEMMGQLAGAMAHEINNLLQPVIGLGGMLREEAAEGSPVAADLDVILLSARKAAAILHDVLTFARPADGSTMTPRRLSEAVRECLRFLRSLLPPSVRLEVALAPEPGDMVMQGGTAIQQILANLVTNAAQAMEHSGTITITVAPVALADELATVLEVPRGEYVLMAVADTGCGMDAATRAMMFEPFFTTKPAGQGTGLGLSVVHGIVRGMGGAISVDTRPGGGTVIGIYMPRVDGAVA